MTKYTFNPYEQGYRERLAQRDAARTNTVNTLTGKKKYKITSSKPSKVNLNNSYGLFSVTRGIRRKIVSEIIIFDIESGGLSYLEETVKWLKPKEATLYRLKGYTVTEL